MLKKYISVRIVSAEPMKAQRPTGKRGNTIKVQMGCGSSTKME